MLLGLLLSAAMELTQLLVPGRNTSMADLITNVVGSGLGGLWACCRSVWRLHGLRRPVRDHRAADRSALLLGFCWAAWLFFPLFPVLGRYVLSQKLAVFAHSRVVDPVLLYRLAACWYAAGLLGDHVGQVSRGWFFVTLLAIPAQFFIVEKQPLPSLLLGAVAGVALFAVVHRASAPTLAEAAAFLTVILIRGLSPFHFASGPVEFGWIPFGATLTSEWQSAAGVLIEKAFYYGTAIWLLRAAGLRLAFSIMLVAAVLAAIEIAQLWLPGRTPEITDPILAILMGLVSRPLRGRQA